MRPSTRRGGENVGACFGLHERLAHQHVHRRVVRDLAVNQQGRGRGPQGRGDVEDDADLEPRRLDGVSRGRRGCRVPALRVVGAQFRSVLGKRAMADAEGPASARPRRRGRREPLHARHRGDGLAAAFPSMTNRARRGRMATAWFRRGGGTRPSGGCGADGPADRRRIARTSHRRDGAVGERLLNGHGRVAFARCGRGPRPSCPRVFRASPSPRYPQRQIFVNFRGAMSTWSVAVRPLVSGPRVVPKILQAASWAAWRKGCVVPRRRALLGHVLQDPAAAPRRVFFFASAALVPSCPPPPVRRRARPPAWRAGWSSLGRPSTIVARGMVLPERWPWLPLLFRRRLSAAAWPGGLAAAISCAMSRRFGPASQEAGERPFAVMKPLMSSAFALPCSESLLPTRPYAMRHE